MKKIRVEYFAVAGFDGKFFRCDHYGTMAPGGCARNFTEAPEAIKRARLEHCIGCAVGQHHVDPTAKARKPLPQRTAFAYRKICVRCRRGGAADDNRLIGRMRLVRNGTMCVSCYNREREVVHGKNAKGARPKKWRDLFFVQIGWVADGGLNIENFDHPVRDRLEAMYTLLRRKDGPRVMAWTAPRAVIRLEEVMA